MNKMSYFLAKSDPSEYGLPELEKDGETLWDGVSNPAALQALRSMKLGDCVLIYHSQGESAIRGWAYAASDPIPDVKNPKLVAVRLKFGGRLQEPVTLADIKATGLFSDFALVRQGRLSTMAVPADFVRWLKAQRKEFKP